MPGFCRGRRDKRERCTLLEPHPGCTAPAMLAAQLLAQHRPCAQPAHAAERTWWFARKLCPLRDAHSLPSVGLAAAREGTRGSGTLLTRGSSFPKSPLHPLFPTQRHLLEPWAPTPGGTSTQHGSHIKPGPGLTCCRVGLLEEALLPRGHQVVGVDGLRGGIRMQGSRKAG